MTTDERLAATLPAHIRQHHARIIDQLIAEQIRVMREALLTEEQIEAILKREEIQ